MTAKVYVIQSTRKQADVSPARSYGEIFFALTHSDRTSLNPSLVYRKLRQVMTQFKPETDYILWSGGDPVSFLLLGSILLEFGMKRVRYLRYEKRQGIVGYDSSTGYYVPVEISLGDFV